uniref:somatostatin receptor type 5-like n=1 Tax=Myxine glutinosa TaxID=7769 RepID=UPI00358E7628
MDSSLEVLEQVLWNDTRNESLSCPFCSSNATPHTEQEIYTAQLSSLIVPVIFFFVCLVGLVGNMLVIYVVLRYAKMKTVTNIYILNLAIADALFMIGLPFMAIQNAIFYWPFGFTMCRIVMAIDSINQFTSIFCLTAMSIDRYLAVVHPVRAANCRKPSIAKIFSCISWLLSIIVVLPVIAFSHTDGQKSMCNIKWPDPVKVWSTVFILYTSLLGFFLPLFIICLCYLLIILKVKSSGMRVNSSKSRRSEKRVTQMVVVVVAVFVLCWLPFYILNIVNLAVEPPEDMLFHCLYLFIVILSYTNSCANPILYAFLSENFKQSFQKALCLKKARGHRGGKNTGLHKKKHKVNVTSPDTEMTTLAENGRGCNH